MPTNHSGSQIITPAGSKPHDKADSFAFVELIG
jgi:hypothetical protein